MKKVREGFKGGVRKGDGKLTKGGVQQKDGDKWRHQNNKTSTRKEAKLLSYKFNSELNSPRTPKNKFSFILYPS